MEDVDGGHEVPPFSPAVVEGALGALDAPEVEAQGSNPGARKGVEQGTDHDRPHIAAELWVGVGQHRRRPGLVGHGELALEGEIIRRRQPDPFVGGGVRP